MNKRYFLLIDDSDLITTIVNNVLKKAFEDVDILIAKSYTEGMSLYALHHEKIELVFVDLYLKDGNGLDILHWIMSETPQAKAIIVSGNLPIDGDDPTPPPSGVFADAKALLRKPFTPHQLLELTQRVLANG